LQTLPAQAQEKIELTPETFTTQDFKLGSGEVLPELTIQYATLGEPVSNDAGDITNAVLIPHGWSGDYSQTVTIAGDLAGPGKAIDTDRYFVIFPTALGSPGSSAPSTSGMGPDFPDYTVGDMVESQKALLDHLGVSKLRGVSGISMGGMQTLAWITRYSDKMDWAIPIAASPSIKGRNLGIFGLMSHQITSDPAYADGNYSEQPREAMQGNRV
jgi:homoserine O-acetyltransferase